MDRITLPDINVPLIDPRTGKVNDIWRAKLEQIVQTLNGLL